MVWSGSGARGPFPYPILPAWASDERGRERERAADFCRQHALPLTRAPSGAGTQREELPANAPQAASSINRLINGTVHKLVYRTFLPSLRSLEVRHPTCLSDSRVRL